MDLDDVIDLICEDDLGEQKDASTQTCNEIDWYQDGYDFSKENSECIVSVSPQTSHVGGLVRVFGYGFAAATTFYFGIHPALTLQIVNHTEACIVVPSMHESVTSVGVSLVPLRTSDNVPREQKVCIKA